MTHILKLISLLFITLFIFASCEEVVDIEVDDAETLTVVEAWLDNRDTAQVIRITQTQTYFDSNFTPAVTGAQVKVNSSNGNSYIFTDQGDGNYIWDEDQNTLGEIGDSFELDIQLDGKQISASAEMFISPEIDSIAQEISDDPFTEGVRCQFYARDPLGIGNSYWIKSYKNHEYLSNPQEINLAFDAGFDDGGIIDGLIFITPIRELINPVVDSIGQSSWETGDTVTVEIHSLNNDAFFFMSSVRDQLLNSLNGLFASPLVNSPGNIINETSDEEVLGVFNVSAVTSKEIVIEL